MVKTDDQTQWSKRTLKLNGRRLGRRMVNNGPRESKSNCYKRAVLTKRVLAIGWGAVLHKAGENCGEKNEVCDSISETNDQADCSAIAY